MKKKRKIKLYPSQRKDKARRRAFRRWMERDLKVA